MAFLGQDLNNADCFGIVGGDAVIDECGVCGGDGIQPDNCDCDNNKLDICGVCGGDVENEDECINYALSFNGNGDYVDFDNPDILNFNHENDFTICLWFKTNSALPSFSLFDKRVSPSPQIGIHIFYKHV